MRRRGRATTAAGTAALRFLSSGRIFSVAQDQDKRSDRPNPLVSAAKYSEIGFIIPAAVFLGYALGWLLDHWLHTHWIYIAGVIFGAVVGFVQMIRTVVAVSRDKSDQ
jgi:F0F1-type ATP synthase assembly protein I